MIEAALLDKLHATRDASVGVAEALRAAANNADEKTLHELHALAARLEVCNHYSNTWIAENAINPRTGEPFTATGRYWFCGSKMCSGCLREQARRNRVKLREAIASQPHEKGDRWYFITLTIPNPRRDILSTRDIVNDAWVRFRHTKTFGDLIRGAAKSEEFTLTPNGYHYHLHMLTRSAFISYARFRYAWTKCVDAAFDKAGIKYTATSKDGCFNVDFKPLAKPNEKTVQEVCKYITKSDSWSKMRPQDLVALASIARWPRMFELVGTFKPSSQRSDRVHTRNISGEKDRSEPVYWRKQVERIGARAYADVLFAEFETTKLIRMEQLQARWPNASIREVNPQGWLNPATPSIAG